MAVFAAPMLAGYVAYFFWRPTHFSNYGVLLKPTPVQDVRLVTTSGQPFHPGQLKGKWILMAVVPARCDAACGAQLHAMHVAFVLQGRERDRMAQVWLELGSQAVGVASPDAAGVWQVRDPGRRLSRQLAVAGHSLNAIYIIDPLGNVMMRYGSPVDIRKMSRDIKKLLSVSQIG